MALYVQVRDGEALRASLHATGMSAVVIARRIGIDRSRFTKLINGSAPIIRLDTARRIEAELHEEPGRLFGFDAEEFGPYLTHEKRAAS